MSKREKKSFRVIDKLIESEKDSALSNLMINPRF